MNPRSWFTRIGKSPIMRMMFGSSVLRAAGLGITLLTSIVLARVLGPTGLGHYSFALAVITVISLPIHMGLPTLVLRETAKAGAAEDWSRMRGLWSWASRRISIISIITIALVVPTLWLFGDSLVPAGSQPTLWVCLALIPLIAIAQVRGAAVRGLHHPVLGLMPDAVVRPAGLVLLLAIVWAMGTRVTAENAMGLHVVAAVVASILGVFLLFKVSPPNLHKVAASHSEQSSWQRALLPLALLAGTQIIMQNASLLLLGLWQSPEQVGYFKIAVSAANMALLGLTAINLVMAPTFVKLYAKGDLKALQRKAGQSAFMAIGTALPIAVLLSVMGKQILALLYGEPFVAAYIPLLILLVGQICNAWFGSCANLLNMSGHERTSLKVMVTAMVANVGLCIALIPTWGATGAAFATSVTTLGWNVAIAFAVRHKLAIASSPLGLLRTMALRPSSPQSGGTKE